jgi:lipopolysaccharide heptosyltransferase I
MLVMRRIADPRSPRILIVRLSAIGDVVLTMPVLNALRDHFPRAFLAWAVEERAAPLLRGHRALDELIVLPRRFLKSPPWVWELYRRLRALRFDVAIDVQGLTKSAVVARLSAARRRIGLGGRWGRELSPWLNSELVYPTRQHVIERMLELLRPLGIEQPGVRFDVPLQEAEIAAAVRWVRQLGLEGGFAVINPGAGSPSRLWPLDRYAAVARHLGVKWALPSVVVWAGAAERSDAERIAGESAGHARVAPPTSLRELAALARLARVFVSSDTGPLHLAEAVGTPCVGLHGPWPAEETGPYGPQHIAVQKAVFAGTSSRERRRAPSSLMEAIDVASVCEACDAVLSRRGAQVA